MRIADLFCFYMGQCALAGNAFMYDMHSDYHQDGDFFDSHDDNHIDNNDDGGILS